MDATKILTAEEVQAVLADLHRRAKRSLSSQSNLAIFRLACCCGLRRKELCGLDMGDLLLAGPRPCLRVRKAITKGQEGKRRGRKVPLWWDKGTLEDLRAWHAVRVSQGAGAGDPLVISCRKATFGKRLPTVLAAKRWKTAIRSLGPDRVRQLHIHCGRHSFCSHALSAGRTIVEVRDAAGHANISTTSIYLHVLDRGDVPDVFERKD